MSRLSFGRLFAGAAVVTWSFLAGCASTTDLQAVAKYGQTASAARESFADIAADFAGSCFRRRELTLPPRELVTTQIGLAPAYPTEPPATAPAAAAAASAAPVPTGSFRDPRCANAAAVSADWTADNDVVLGYVRKLGEIASLDAAPTFSPLGDALVAPGMLSATQNSAFAALANDLSQQLVAGDQRRLIASTVRLVDPSFRVAVASLKQVDTFYGDMLDSEFNETFVYYHCLIASELAARPPISAVERPGLPCPSEGIPATISPALRAQVLGQRRAFDEALAAINRRRTSTVAYAGVLDELEKTHETLYDATTRGATMGDYLGVLQTTVLPLEIDVRSLQAAVK
jgi:hypothetical protein